MIVKLTQDLARGFAPWKAMFYENEAELNALGAKLIWLNRQEISPVISMPNLTVVCEDSQSLPVAVQQGLTKRLVL